MWAFEPHHTPADVWSLGVVIGWMLTLRDPMGEATMPEWEAAVSSNPPKLPWFEQQVDGTLEPLAAIARRCCAVMPAERPAAAAVREELAALLRA